MNKDMRKILDAIRDAGYTVKQTRKGHIAVYAKDGTWVTTFSGTPSDHRSIRNALAPLRRRGFRWP